MEFRRKVYDELLEWKSMSGSSAAMIQGARRVGKSTVAERFAREQYKSYIMIDFVEADKSLTDLFVDYKADLDMLFNRLQLITSVKLHRRSSVIIFDEVQAFPPAREMIKALVRDGRYDYIETGSLLTVKSKAAGIRIPSEEHRIRMYPMDFEEWLWANGDEAVADMLRSLTQRMEPLGDSAHKVMMRRFTEYMIVGGMPQAVSIYVQSRDLMKAESVKRDILSLYHDDICKIPGPAMSRALNLFDRIPALLSSPHKVLSPIKIEKGTRKRDYDAAIGWLCDAMLFNICRCSSDPSMAIGLSEDVARVKCYLLDTGLLISLAFMKDRKALNEAYGLMLDGKLSVNRGMFFENVVSQELISQGYDLWFTEFEKEGSGRKYEVDFILPDGSGIVPLEVKSSRSTIHSSLDKLMGKYRDRIGKAYVVHSKDLRVDGDLVYLPIYMLPFIRG